MKKRLLSMIVGTGLAVSACGGEVEFTAIDAEGLVGVVDAAFTEESGLRGLLTAEAFTPEDLAEFNTLAEDACGDLADGFGADEYDEFEVGVLDGAEGLEEMIDAGALAVALVDATCPSYKGVLSDAMNG